MVDRVASDHSSLETLDAELVSHGPGSRRAVELSGDVTVPTGEVVRLVVDGAVRYTKPSRFAGETIRISGAFDAPDHARSPADRPNRLREWLDRTDLATGRTVHLDVIEEEFKYGLREPGERVVYDAPETPEDSLASIASRLEDDREQ